MFSRDKKQKKSGFTLIEILIVSGILAVLATVTVLLLNPAQFMAQGRDARRISDLKNIDTAISLVKTSLYETVTDTTQANIVYVSLYDKDGDINDDCRAPNEYPDLPPLSGTWQYRCRAIEANLRKINGTGWIPINLSTSPLVVLPVDPVNNQNNYYTYSWDASSNPKPTVAAKLESQKYLDSYANNEQGDGGNNNDAFETRPIAWSISVIPETTSPIVTSLTVTSITETGATLGADVTSDGGAAITARGTCWETSPAPITNCLAEGGTTTGVFTHARNSMPLDTLIYYRGYATNIAGTGYSSDGIFETLEPEQFLTTAQTTTAYNKYEPQFQVSDSKIYYVWYEYDGAKRQIWTANSNLDGTGFAAAKRTTTAYDKYTPQLQVSDLKIYYIWREYDGAKYQIWTANSNLDGTGFAAAKRTTTAYNKYEPQLQVSDTKIYYVWREYDGAKTQIWTANSNLDGTGFAAAKQTTTAYFKYNPQLQVSGLKIYYLWEEDDGFTQIWTANSNLDGTGFAAAKQTTTAYYKFDLQLQAYGSKINYVWQEYDGAKTQIWTANSNLDGTGFIAAKRTTTAYNKNEPQLQISGLKIYYVWLEANPYSQIWTAWLSPLP